MPCTGAKAALPMRHFIFPICHEVLSLAIRNNVKTAPALVIPAERLVSSVDQE